MVQNQVEHLAIEAWNLASLTAAIVIALALGLVGIAITVVAVRLIGDLIRENSSDDPAG